MQLKKIFLSLLVVVIAVATLTFAVSAANDSVEFAVSIEGTADSNGDIVFAPGETFDVVLDVHNNPGIALLDVQIKYDTNVLTYVKYEIGNFLDEKHVPDLDTAAGLLGFASEAKLNPAPIVDEDGEVIKDGEIVTITFKVKDDAHADSSSIKINYAEAYNASYDAVTVVKTNGKFAVHDVKTTPGKEATCFEEGYTDAVQCTKCEYGIASEKYGPLNHPEEFLQVIPAVPGSCTTLPLSEGQICTKCGTITIEQVVGDAVAHTPDGKWVVDSAATHLAPGKQHQNCANCGKVAIEAEIPQILAHNWVVDGAPVAPTCLGTGYTNYKCECGDTKQDDIVPATGHAWDKGEITTKATCLNNGEITYSCKNCDETKTANIDALGHTWDNGVVTTQPTCTTVGEKTFTCSACKEIRTENVAMVAHTYVATVVAPTCTTAGFTAHKCACGAYYEDTLVVATGHAWDKGEITTKATCLNNGEITYSCKNCDETKTANVDALGHAWDNGVVTTQPTCTTVGEKTFTCSACKEIRTENVAMVAHTYVATVVAPTCTTAGFTAHKCECGAYYEDTLVDAIGHAWDKGEITTKATCLNNGEITYSCENCDETKTANIDALGHTWDNGVVTTQPTCTTVGEKTFTCSACKEVKTENVAMVAHNYVETVVAPTCTAAGFTAHKCECGAYYEDTLVDATGHTFAEGEKVEASCNKPGEITYACPCGVKYTVVTELAKHDYETKVTDATCTATGVKTNTCKVCGDVYVESIDMIPHTFEDQITDPTCTAMGYTTHVCTVCGHKSVDTFVDAKGHNFGAWTVTVESTKDANGVEERVCSVCTEKETVEIPQLPANTGMIVIIIVLAVLVLGNVGFIVYWFVIKKKN